jgi:hypothetical protein
MAATIPTAAPTTAIGTSCESGTEKLVGVDAVAEARTSAPR